jgi:hypothetical protein
MNERAMQANNQHSPSVSTPLSATAISTIPTTTTSTMVDSAKKACKSMQKHAKGVLVLQRLQKVIFSLTLLFL